MSNQDAKIDPKAYSVGTVFRFPKPYQNETLVVTAIDGHMVTCQPSYRKGSFELSIYTLLGVWRAFVDEEATQLNLAKLAAKASINEWLDE
jgi:hypothetical protein